MGSPPRYLTACTGKQKLSTKVNPGAVANEQTGIFTANPHHGGSGSVSQCLRSCVKGVKCDDLI